MVDTTICCFQSCAWVSAGECALKWLCEAAVVIFVLWVVTGIYTWIKNKNGPNKVMIWFKFWVYRHAFIILLILLPVSVILALACGWEVLVPIIGFGYFLNRQYLAETEMLWDLLKYFNKKYADNIAEFSLLYKNDNSNNLINYLNLCSEEYLLYTQGYVPPIVWKTWRKGMYKKLEYCEDSAHKELGDDGAEYYGLTWEEIKKGAETND